MFIETTYTIFQDDLNLGPDFPLQTNETANLSASVFNSVHDELVIEHIKLIVTLEAPDGKPSGMIEAWDTLESFSPVRDRVKDYLKELYEEKKTQSQN